MSSILYKWGVDGPSLLWPLLDGLIWRSRMVSQGGNMETWIRWPATRWGHGKRLHCHAFSVSTVKCKYLLHVPVKLCGHDVKIRLQGEWPNSNTSWNYDALLLGIFCLFWSPATGMRRVNYYIQLLRLKNQCKIWVQCDFNWFWWSWYWYGRKHTMLRDAMSRCDLDSYLYCMLLWILSDQSCLAHLDMRLNMSLKVEYF